MAKELVIKSKKHGVFVVFYSECDQCVIEANKWHIWKNSAGKFYARSYILGSLHRVILNYPNSLVDHISRNTLDNTRENLRIVNKSQNNINKDKYKTLNKFKGVSYNRFSGRWRARITMNGKVIYGGCFVNETDAAKKYNEMASKYHGEYAVLNNL